MFQAAVYSRPSWTLTDQQRLSHDLRMISGVWVVSAAQTGNLRFIRCFVLMTAIGLLLAINLPITNAFSAPSAPHRNCHLPTTSLLPPGTTSLTNPISLASSAPNFLPVNASSRALESFPVIFGNRCRVPISAASPTSTSYFISVGPYTGTYHDAKH